jgi:hypothetical protein
MKNNFSIDQKAKVMFTPIVLNGDGSVFKKYRRQRNLILDQGLDCIFGTGGGSYTSRNFTGGIDNARYGTGTNPFERDGGTVTFTASSGVLTASAGFFESNDVGRLFRAASGQLGYITSFTNNTTVAWGGVDFASASLGRIYYVNRTGLQSQVKTTRTYRNSGGDNGTSWTDFSNGIIRHKKSYLFSAETGARTVTEVGWGFGGGGQDNGPLFGGALLTSPVSLTTGQQLLLVIELFITWSPMVSTAASNQGTGMDTAGTHSIRDARTTSIGSYVDGNGNSVAINGIDHFGGQTAAYGASIGFITASFADGDAAQSSFSVTSINKSPATLEAYTNGSFFRIISAEIGVSEGNGTIYGFCIIGTSCIWAHRFTTGHTKTNEYKMVCRIRISANRDYS